MAEPLNELKDVDRNLFPGSLTIRALRDSRYHNSAYALAELIDNSVEASAGRIDILCQETAEIVNVRTKHRLTDIAVIDDGEGMDVKTLIEALKFGGGTRHNSNKGIGKYGMGLPTSSMSQCKKVDIWTWQKGPNSVWHASIDADDIERGNHQVPFPDQETPIPKIWKDVGNNEIFENESGTLVVWSNLDKIHWRTGKALIDNTAREVGRIHRRYIEADITKIRAIIFQNNRPSDFKETEIVANDPLYIMKPSAVPEEPWNKESMFKKWGERIEYTVKVDGKEQTIFVNYSIVKPEALKTETLTQNPGNTPRGRHARHNIGVSVVREDREIVLEDAFLREGGSADNPQNRWWGCEVEFFRDCDELFGIDHNKQMVAHFTQAAKTLARDDRANQVILDELGIENDIIFEIVCDIRNQTRAMMTQITKMFEQKRSVKEAGGKKKKKTPEKKAAETATDADRDAIMTRLEEPTHTDQDRGNTPLDERIEGLKEQYVKDGNTEQDAKEIAEYLVKDDIWYRFSSDNLDGYQMFNVRSNQGVLHINFNTDHPVYDLLKNIESDQEDEIIDENHPAFEASVAIRLLLSSWARMEDQTENKEERKRIQDIATNWGRQVDKAITQFREKNG